MLTYDIALATRTAYRSLVIATYCNTCAWCGERITGRDFEAHHWLIKRSAYPKALYHVINKVINVVPLHEKCHARHGQSMAMQDKCHEFVSTFFDSQIISDWETQLHRSNVYDHHI